MFFRFIYLFMFLSFFSYSSLNEAVSLYNQGDYERVRAILGKENFEENIKAQFYLLAAQGFEREERADHLIQGLKAFIQPALSNSRNEHHVSARLVRAFWNLYSPHTVRRPAATTGQGMHVEEMHVVHRERLTATTAPREDSSGHDVPLLLETETENVRVDIDSRLMSPTGPGLERLDIQEVLDYIQNSQFFPIDNLFEGTPSEEAGLKELHDLVREKNHHAFYFLGAFYLNDKTNPDPSVTDQLKGSGLGYMIEAGYLKNIGALGFCKKMLNLEASESWIENCKIWCLAGVAAGDSRLGCGADPSGRWWNCGLGLWGFKTRWTAGQLFSSVRNVSRETLENVVMLAGMGLMFVQLIDSSGFISIFEDKQTIAGWTGLLLSGGGFGAARILPS